MFANKDVCTYMHACICAVDGEDDYLGVGRETILFVNAIINIFVKCYHLGNL